MHAKVASFRPGRPGWHGRGVGYRLFLVPLRAARRGAARTFRAGRSAFGRAGAFRRAGFLGGALRGAVAFFADLAFGLAFRAGRAGLGPVGAAAGGSGAAGPDEGEGAWPLTHHVAKCSALGNMAHAALSPSRLKARAITIRGA
jgi:hypothetical protein